jgi:ABC-type polysaccharide/polyol phosphate transport system ATPase subunit
MSDTVITVENLSKRYLVGHCSDRRKQHTTFREMLMREARNFACKAADLVRGRQIVQGDIVEEFWALKNVSFELKRGGVLGVIGRNGAGKSTLLKILSRITEPTEGRVLIEGRVASMLEVGTGFHPELTGRENIFLNGAILGMSRVEIKRKFDEIVAFAEVEKFLDTPVKRYSSGMYVRLAFGVAAHLEPEILLVDEVLSVGDTEFQKKCLGKMSDVAEGGRTVVFVSHNMTAIRQLCSHAILLKGGTIEYEGELSGAVQRYLADAEGTKGIWQRKNVTQGRAVIEQIVVRSHDGAVTDQFFANDSVRVEVKVKCIEKIPSAQVAVRITNSEGIPIFTTTNTDGLDALVPIQPGQHLFSFRIPGSFLSIGRYYLVVSICMPRIEIIDVVTDEIVFNIETAINHATRFHDDRRGVVTPLIAWEHTHDSGSK